MRAMTVRQPWAWAIIHGQKDVENRSRNIAGSYRGPVAITAAAADAEDAPWSLWLDHANYYRSVQDPNYKGIASERGVVLGIVDLVDVHLTRATYTGRSCFDGETPTGELCSEWAQFMPVGGYHLVLANPRPLTTPIPIRGRLGLWTLPDDIAAQVEEALR